MSDVQEYSFVVRTDRVWRGRDFKGGGSRIYFLAGLAGPDEMAGKCSQNYTAQSQLLSMTGGQGLTGKLADDEITHFFAVHRTPNKL